MNRLKGKFNKELVSAMKKEHGYKNKAMVPRVEKITLNIGTSQAKGDSHLLEIMRDNLNRIAGQAPVLTRAKKSISGFGVREGMVVGIMVTLRGEKMYDFLDKLINVILPRVRDFHGVNSNSIDQSGNLTIGFRECTVFPEIDPNKVELIHGLEVSLHTSAQSRTEGIHLFKALGFPLTEN